MKQITLPENLITMFENDSLVGWAIKDTNSSFIYVNNTFKTWQTISTRYNYEGLNIRDIPVPVAEFSDIFNQQEREIERTGKAVRAITTHIQGTEKIMQPAYNVQEPIYDEHHNCIGTVISVRHVRIITPTSLLNGTIMQHSTFEPPSKIFTEKEWEVIYLLVCGMMLKDIGSILSITVDAVNSRLRSCYRKTGLNSLSGLKEYCRANKFDNYIPLFFLKKGHIIIKG
ncbi:helix-turn-helix transcriptional regulator [Pectobacterium actinidiae]|uniref:Helix-turn-helix transcriptional regulator n=1 Tax=Pectobacterium actinidiae TaxID=1507808 RepID=A0A1V2R9L7_9GAMM|nr:LuxR C-terminal-related transcriptional regulator [Pectobacterium actinidiae]GKW16729.1 LuxR family transcriptional regulator [Pectobacterium carotovorum subsp. carotovorum]KHN90130.1 LuxR family transcriptional regulator [Pectobacterium actinidiae]MDY4316804.1 LuxR C-terminal-related transcriptional regulator [Pectobacterium actinidiae]ONK07033.1 helix-turn-helix transcriptional regulator [Pectobacterium actinidiae]ONK09052.1 helix-turn-helix transcriptional regulator [Pectobacterium actin